MELVLLEGGKGERERADFRKGREKPACDVVAVSRNVATLPFGSVSYQ